MDAPVSARCSVDGCVRPARSRGWCLTHVDRIRAGADVETRISTSGRRRLDIRCPACGVETFAAQSKRGVAYRQCANGHRLTYQIPGHVFLGAVGESGRGAPATAAKLLGDAEGSLIAAALDLRRAHEANGHECRVCAAGTRYLAALAADPGPALGRRRA